MVDDFSDNLFAAGKSYAVAARRLVAALPLEPGSALPALFLSAFAFELSLKAAIYSVEASEPALRAIGHDLKRALQEAKRLGYAVPETGNVELVIDDLADCHSDFSYRYIPSGKVELKSPDPRRLPAALAAHIDAIEEQFDVWKGTPDLP